MFIGNAKEYNTNTLNLFVSNRPFSSYVTFNNLLLFQNES